VGFDSQAFQFLNRASLLSKMHISIWHSFNDGKKEWALKNLCGAYAGQGWALKNFGQVSHVKF
jgi:hypothetical protein